MICCNLQDALSKQCSLTVKLSLFSQQNLISPLFLPNSSLKAARNQISKHVRSNLTFLVNTISHYSQKQLGIMETPSVKYLWFQYSYGRFKDLKYWTRRNIHQVVSRLKKFTELPQKIVTIDKINKYVLQTSNQDKFQS